MQFLILRGIPLQQKESLVYVDEKPEISYTPVPKIYDKSNWPTKTNRPCYMCTIVTNRKPFFVPSIITSDGIINRGTHPIVCCPSCAMNWILSKANDDSEIRRYISYVQEFLFAITGYKVGVIQPSQDRGELQKFGGTLTEHQYQREILISSGDYIQFLYDSYQDYEDDLS
jgi:hypothetical protein